MSFTATGSEGDGWIGRVIDGRYRVQSRVGIGGMGTVYRVEHVLMGKVAAMKVLHRALARDAGAVKRFRREVAVVSRLEHPNIVQTFDCGDCDGQLYLVMEYVKGDDLGGIVWREGPLPAARALVLAMQVCSALEEAHERGVVHCDLKPDNIVCARRRQVEQAKVLDFGLAKLREGPELGELSASGLMGGTPSYMSPEQVRSGSVDARSDLYSLGATLYRMLTGETPFAASSPIEAMRCHLTDHLVPPSRRAPALRLPEAVDRVVLRAMARSREDRYASAAEMRTQLGAVLNGISEVTLPPRPPRASAEPTPAAEDSDSVLERDDLAAFERSVRWRRRLAPLLVAPLLLALALAASAAFPFLRPPPSTAAPRSDLLPRASARGGGREGVDALPGFPSARPEHRLRPRAPRATPRRKERPIDPVAVSPTEPPPTEPPSTEPPSTEPPPTEPPPTEPAPTEPSPLTQPELSGP